MARIGAWHPDLRDDAWFDAGILPDGWFWDDVVSVEETGGVTGTLAVTLDGATLAGTGAVPVGGALAVTLDAVALAATGAVGVDGTLSVALDGVALAGAGAVAAAGS